MTKLRFNLDIGVVNGLSGTRRSGFNISLVGTGDSTVLKDVQQPGRNGSGSRAAGLTPSLKLVVPSAIKSGNGVLTISASA